MDKIKWIDKIDLDKFRSDFMEFDIKSTGKKIPLDIIIFVSGINFYNFLLICLKTFYEKSNLFSCNVNIFVERKLIEDPKNFSFWERLRYLKVNIFCLEDLNIGFSKYDIFFTDFKFENDALFLDADTFISENVLFDEFIETNHAEMVFSLKLEETPIEAMASRYARCSPNCDFKDFVDKIHSFKKIDKNTSKIKWNNNGVYFLNKSIINDDPLFKEICFYARDVVQSKSDELLFFMYRLFSDKEAEFFPSSNLSVFSEWLSPSPHSIYHVNSCHQPRFLYSKLGLDVDIKNDFKNHIDVRYQNFLSKDRIKRYLNFYLFNSQSDFKTECLFFQNTLGEWIVKTGDEIQLIGLDLPEIIFFDNLKSQKFIFYQC